MLSPAEQTHCKSRVKQLGLMPVTSAKTDFSYVGQAIHYAPKGQQFVQLNKNVNKTKSSQVGAVTASGGPSKHEYVNVCTCAARSI